jgi:hypothetical protein
MSDNVPHAVKHGKLVLPADALEKLQAERMASIQHHLDELGKALSVENNDLDLVLTAELAANFNLGDAKERQEVLDRCVAMAKLISDHKLRRLHESVRELCAELNVHDAPPAIVWSAKRAGVELFPPPPAD